MFDRYADNAACDKAIRSIREGEPGALAVLYDKLHRSVFALAVSICGNRYDAEDVLQDTLCEIVKSAPAYHGGNARAWVLAITRNLALRTLQKRRESVDVDNLADTLRYATSKDSLETSEILADALARLTDSERETVVLKAVDGLTHREIASLTGCSVDAAKRTYYRGIQKLKRYMKGE